MPGISQLLLRTVPSAGALYPLGVYLMVQEVEEVPDGLQHYNVREHTLKPARPGAPWADLQDGLLDEFLSTANAVMFPLSRPRAEARGHGLRGCRGASSHRIRSERPKRVG